MYVHLLYKYPILDMGLYQTNQPTVVQVNAPGMPWVPKIGCDKKMEHFKNSLTTMKKSTDDWRFVINLVATNNLFPWLTIELQGSDLLHLAHSLLYGDDNAESLKIKLTLEVAYRNLLQISQTAKIEQLLDPISRAGNLKVFGKRNIAFPKELLDSNHFWKKINEVQSYFISISVDISNYAPIEDYHHFARNLNQKLLDDAICSDFKIIAMDGTPFTCHKIFLSAQSQVFAAMFQGRFTETQEEQLEWMEMPAEGVKSFLEFLYYGETRGAVKSCDIALHLFVAADKYDIKGLRHAMSQIFCGKGRDWYTNDTAWKLYKFLMYYEGVEKHKLIGKVLDVLAWNINELEEKIMSEDITNPKILKDMFFHSLKALGRYVPLHHHME